MNEQMKNKYDLEMIPKVTTFDDCPFCVIQKEDTVVTRVHVLCNFIHEPNVHVFSSYSFMRTIFMHFSTHYS